MRENYLHYIWKYGLFDSLDLKSTEEEKIEILHRGDHNAHAGPDFFSARINIGGTVWAGNVEIHIKSSDWYRHQHHKDPAYDNVILHVVLLHDKEILNSKGQHFPTLSLSNRIDQKHLEKFNQLITNQSEILCATYLRDIDDLIVLSMKERALISRLQRKAHSMMINLDRTGFDLRRMFYEQIAINFGFKVNAEAFEELAKRLDLSIIQRHADSRMQIEALLFGVAGFLSNNFYDDYPIRLKNEYAFLNTKYKLQNMRIEAWKFGRLRPSNFPTIRIAQFAAFLFKNRGLVELGGIRKTNEWKEMFEVVANDYWTDHIRFDRPSKFRLKRLGKSSVENILINSISPISFVQGQKTNKEEAKQRALALLYEIPAEKNKAIEAWQKIGVKAKDAFDSQALLELKNEWCDKKRCLNCSIGVSLMKHEFV
ncbi:MAG: DUF2851 family protein [Bacteroidota bacterium]